MATDASPTERSVPLHTRLVPAAKLAGRYALLTIVAAIVLFPVYAAVMVAQKPLAELGDLGVLVPDRVNVDSVPTALTDARMGRYLLNSLIVSVAITVGQVATSVLAGYAFAFLDFTGRRSLLVAFSVALIVPFEVTVVVNFETVQRLGGIDTYWALIVPFLAFPLGMFLMRQAFLSIPRDLRDAAIVDGYGHLGFLRSVALPLVRPTVAALSLFSFLLAWNQYLWPLLVTNSADRRTVQIGLEQLAGATGPDVGVIMAATLIATIPIFVLLVIFERQLIRGLTAGSVKG
ncbi:MAG: carbohydrate ABC transporter permease [Acidimicrobiia bacterium]|nr:carbohydrate ABC transporter permease [Acidimicrobiia bacterium]